MNKLLVDIQTYCTISSKLSALSSKLESLSAQLSGIELSQEAGSTLQLALSSIRFSLIGTSLADEIAELAIKRVARVTKSTAAEAADLRLRILSAVDMLESGEQELVARINDLCTDASEWEQRQGAASAVSAWQQELDINHITKAFDLVKPPDGQSPIIVAEQIKNDRIYQNLEGLYAILSANFSDAAQNGLTREQYLTRSLLESCSDPDFVPWTAEDLVRQLKNGNSLFSDLIFNESVLEYIEKKTSLNLNSDQISFGIDITSDAFNAVVNTINELRLLQSLDKTAALSMAQAYINSDNENMQHIGRYVTNLVNSPLPQQLACVTGENVLSFGIDAAETTAGVAVNAAIATLSSPAAFILPGMDLVGNISNNAGLTNDLIYSAEAARTMYDGFQDAYAAYQADPSDANLERAMASYSAYNRAISNSYEAYADYTANTTDSFVGKFTTSEAAQNVDEQARSVSSIRRDLARDMDAERSTRTT